jgi:predicted porin
MKKSLLALSILAAFAGVAHAQSAVTVYGIVDMAYQNENRGAGSRTVNALDSGIQSGSRLGFKGTEDLGGNLKANFQLEMGVNADTGASSQGGVTFGRQAWVGLSGDFGSVNMGRQYTPIFVAVDTIDPWSTGFISGHAGEGTSSEGIATPFGTPFRTNNTLNYTTNNLGGFTGSAAYTFGEVSGSSNLRQIGLSGTYAAGPIVGTLAYHKANDTTGRATKIAFLGGTYDFGPAKLHAAFGKTTSDFLITTTPAAGTTPASTTVSPEHREWMVGTSVPFGAATLLASYTRIDNKRAAGSTAATRTDGKSNQMAIGGTYSLSKRTNLYTSFSRTTNDANTNVGNLAAANGATDRLFNVGVRHKF